MDKGNFSFCNSDFGPSVPLGRLPQYFFGMWERTPGIKMQFISENKSGQTSYTIHNAFANGKRSISTLALTRELLRTISCYTNRCKWKHWVLSWDLLNIVWQRKSLRKSRWEMVSKSMRYLHLQGHISLCPPVTHPPWNHAFSLILSRHSEAMPETSGLTMCFLK